ncbi:MAG: type II secretion system protein GspM [Pseudomonadota bacterium]|nr:type II secretion system protein GspM [Pseudomonadota bacterium]
MWMQINQAWSQLAERERTMVIALAAFLGVVLFYLVIWSPIHSANQQAIQSEQRALQEWQWLNDQVLKYPMVQKNKDALKFTTQSQLMSSLQSSLRNENLLSSMGSMTPSAKTIKVDFKEVNAPQLFSWLSFLEKQGLVSKQLQINAVKPGIVQASVRFGVIQ